MKVDLTLGKIWSLNLNTSADTGQCATGFECVGYSNLPDDDWGECDNANETEAPKIKCPKRNVEGKLKTIPPYYGECSVGAPFSNLDDGETGECIPINFDWLVCPNNHPKGLFCG
jgi:hypothetical protein